MFCLFICFRQSHIAQAGLKLAKDDLELLILTPKPLKCWDCGCGPAHLVCAVRGIQPTAVRMLDRHYARWATSPAQRSGELTVPWLVTQSREPNTCIFIWELALIGVGRTVLSGCLSWGPGDLGASLQPRLNSIPLARNSAFLVPRVLVLFTSLAADESPFKREF